MRDLEGKINSKNDVAVSKTSRLDFTQMPVLSLMGNIFYTATIELLPVLTALKS